MPGDNFWLCITALAAIVDGSPAESDESLDQMEIDLREWTKSSATQCATAFR